MRSLRIVVFALGSVAVGAVACAQAQSTVAATSSPATQPKAVVAAAAKPAAAQAETPTVWPSEPAMPGHTARGTIVVMGDSVLVGSGITPPGKTLAQQLGELLHRPAITLGRGGLTATVAEKIPSIPGDASTVVLYVGTNDTTVAASDATPEQASQRDAAFERDFERLVHGVRARVPQAEIALITVRDLGRAGVRFKHTTPASLTAAVHAFDAHEREVAARLGIRAIVDTESNPKWYVPSEYMPEGFHPRNAALGKLAHDMAAQLAPSG